ncbi:hypothetical protein CUMW_188030 [Citrus unshiu]|uniref:Uncharacterized protein n=1 Tax=Citrus unshiu TaxID=55188 RepID=A0A2H5Q2Q4_CITUN|nr:hypothetical protein CUMW_188030 [Citrus unshiu]
MYGLSSKILKNLVMIIALQHHTFKGKVANLCHHNQILPFRSLQHQHLLVYHHFH